MSAGGTKRPAATRSNLERERRRLGRVQRGRDILSKKRQALVAELFELAGPATHAREQIDAYSREAYRALAGALAIHGADDLLAIARPARQLELEIREAAVWGVQTSELLDRPPLRRSVLARGTAPSSTGPAAIEAAERFESLVEMLLDAAPREMAIEKLGRALSSTSRRVNVLDRRVGPAITRDVDRIRATLDEREREERVRLEHLLRRRR